MRKEGDSGAALARHGRSPVGPYDNARLRVTLAAMAWAAETHHLVPLPLEVEMFGSRAKVAVPGSSYYEPAGWSP